MSTMPAMSGVRPPASTGVPPSFLPRRRLLLADDDSAMRELLAGFLTADGYEVIQAGDGRELIRQLQQVAARPQGRASLAAVVSDVCMPNLDGLDVLAALRCAHWDTPVILMTAFGDEAIRRDARDFGAAAVLDKPFPLPALRTLLHQIAPPYDPMPSGKLPPRRLEYAWGG